MTREKLTRNAIVYLAQAVQELATAFDEHTHCAYADAARANNHAGMALATMAKLEEAGE